MKLYNVEGFVRERFHNSLALAHLLYIYIVLSLLMLNRPNQQVTLNQSFQILRCHKLILKKFHIVSIATEFSISSILLHVCASNEKKVIYI